MEQPASCDLLVVDFEDSPRAPKLTTEDIAELSEEEAAAAQAELDAAFAGRSARYFGLLLLESKPAFMHEVGKAEDGASVNRIERHHAILPSPSQKISSFALVDVRTMSVQFVDKAREIAGEERYLIPQGLLQCTMEASSKELIDTTMRLVEEVANEYGANAAIATAKAKAYVAENAEDSDEVPFDEFVEEVFEDEGPRRSFVEAAQKKKPSRTLPVERAVAKRVTRNHKDPHRHRHRDHLPSGVRAESRVHRVHQHVKRAYPHRAQKYREHREQVAAREGVKRCLGNAVGSPRKPRIHHTQRLTQIRPISRLVGQPADANLNPAAERPPHLLTSAAILLPAGLSAAKIPHLGRMNRDKFSQMVGCKRLNHDGTMVVSRAAYALNVTRGVYNSAGGRTIQIAFPARYLGYNEKIREGM